LDKLDHNIGFNYITIGWNAGFSIKMRNGLPFSIQISCGTASNFSSSYRTLDSSFQPIPNMHFLALGLEHRPHDSVGGLSL